VFNCGTGEFHHATTLRRTDPEALVPPLTMRTLGVIIELHSQTQHLRAFRELIELPNGKSVLAAMTEPEWLDAVDSLYGHVLSPAVKQQAEVGLIFHPAC
jgi:hypothetical protein